MAVIDSYYTYMYSKITINFFLILLFAMVQISFIAGLPAGLNNFNLVLVVLVFILILTDLNLAAWWAIGLGFFLDIFSFSAFGINLLCLSATAVIAYFLLNNFFTNRSLYSIAALVSLSTVFHEVFLALSLFLENFFLKLDANSVFNAAFWSSKLSQLILNLIFSFVLFYLINFVSRKFKPAFLTKKVHS